MNSRAASGALEDGSRAIVETQGLLRKPGSSPTYSVPGTPTMMLLDAKLEIAARQIFDDGAVVGEHGLGFQPLG